MNPFIANKGVVNDTVIGALDNRLHLVTWTGSFGVGKTTLIQEVAKELDGRGCCVAILPSVSTYWFEKENRERAGRNEEPLKYDDVNRLGLRARMQRELPGILGSFVTQAADGVLTKPDYKGDARYILADRWFSDIAAYTAFELQNDPEALTAANKACEDTILSLDFALRHMAANNGHQLYWTHVHIPKSSCKFEATDDKPNRATVDPVEWEYKCAEISDRYCQPQRVLTITRSKMIERVTEVLTRVYAPY